MPQADRSQESFSPLQIEIAQSLVIFALTKVQPKDTKVELPCEVATAAERLHEHYAHRLALLTTKPTDATPPGRRAGELLERLAALPNTELDTAATNVVLLRKTVQRLEKLCHGDATRGDVKQLLAALSELEDAETPNEPTEAIASLSELADGW